MFVHRSCFRTRGFPKEIGQLENGVSSDVWSGYWYNGRIHTNDSGASRELSV